MTIPFEVNDAELRGAFMEEWGRSHFKHAYHHLLQFDLVDGGTLNP